MKPSAHSLPASLALLCAALSSAAPRARAAVDEIGGDTASATVSTAAPESAVLAGPVLLIGDSMMKVGVGPAMKRSLEARLSSRVDLRARSASGLARPDFYDWPKEAAAALAGGGYRSVVVALGTNDCQGFVDNGRVVSYDTPAWREAYRARVAALVDILCQDDRRVVWLGLPPMRDAKFDRRIAALDQLVQETLAARSCVTFVPTRAALADARGRYRAFGQEKARRLRLREDDGVHVTQQGGLVVTETLLGSLRRR